MVEQRQPIAGLEVLHAPLHSGFMLQCSNVNLDQQCLFWNKKFLSSPRNFWNSRATNWNPRVTIWTPNTFNGLLIYATLYYGNSREDGKKKVWFEHDKLCLYPRESKKKMCEFKLMKQIIINHQSIRLSALPKAPLLHTSTIVVVFGRVTVMPSKGGASCIQHHREHPLTTEAIVSWLSNNGSLLLG